MRIPQISGSNALERFFGTLHGARKQFNVVLGAATMRVSFAVYVPSDLKNSGEKNHEKLVCPRSVDSH
jgi:hypothetical protein